MKTQRDKRSRPFRVGLYGGTFDPIHVGHLQVAEDVLRRAALDCIYFIPSAMPPHKRSRMLTPAEDRMAMVRMALEDRRRMIPCDVEIKRGGPSYTIDTVRQLKARASDDQAFFFLVGIDAFLEIHTWWRFMQLFEQITFIVVSRPGSGQWSSVMLEELTAYVRTKISAGYFMEARSGQLKHPALGTIRPLPVTPVDIASSTIRRMIRQQAAYDAWVVPKVKRYIEEKDLYR